MKFYFPIDNPLSNKHRYRSIKSIYLLSSSSSSPSSGIEFDMSDDDGTCNEFHDNDNHHSSLKLSHESFLFLLKCEKRLKPKLVGKKKTMQIVHFRIKVFLKFLNRLFDDEKSGICMQIFPVPGSRKC